MSSPVAAAVLATFSTLALACEATSPPPQAPPLPAAPEFTPASPPPPPPTSASSVAVAPSATPDHDAPPRAAAPPRDPAFAAPPDVAAPPSDAEVTPSGLASKVLTPGSGKVHPRAADTVVVHYTGWTTDGHMFDSSVRRGTPAEFQLTHVIAGWTEGVQRMVVGEKRRLWIPAALAYGDHPRAGAPSGPLTFDVELLDIVAVASAPPDVKAPPADATRTTSGLFYRFLKRGGGDARPKSTDRVKVHYEGWTTDGHLFDGTRARGAPAEFEVDQVIPGWTEGLQLMHVGDAARFWIPANLAYGNTPGAGVPRGMLVFDVELLAIE